jgi:uroporphyrinogen decarboxylase
MPPVYRSGETFRDNWGCVWYNTQEGLEGQVVGHPLTNWDALKTYQPPDFKTQTDRGPRDWAKIEQEIQARKAAGLLTYGDGERLFDRLYFLRGFSQLMLDFAEEPPELAQMIEMLENYEMDLVQRWLTLDVDVVTFHTDLATQRGLMISPASFRKYIKPLYMHLFQTCRKAGAHVLLSTDGRVLEIVDDFIECGVSVHDPQLRANTLDGIARAYKGRLCADVDLDRQGFPYMTPREIRQQIKDVVRVMGDPQGGLMLLAAVYGGDVPLENIRAICDGMEEFGLG